MTLRPDAIGELVLRAGEREQADPERYQGDSVAEFFTAGLIDAPFPESVGGSGWTTLDATRAIGDIAAVAPSAALIASTPLGLAGIYCAGPDLAPEEHRAARELAAVGRCDIRDGSASRRRRIGRHDCIAAKLVMRISETSRPSFFR